MTDNKLIPKIIHQIWLQGIEKMPANLKSYNGSCMYINNDFKYIFWDETKIINLLNKRFKKKYLDLMNLYTKPAQKADFARCAILYVYGGIYLDMDTVCKKNLSKFIEKDVGFFFTSTNDLLNKLYKRYQTGIIGSVPKHPIFKIIFRNMFMRTGYASNLTYSTGTRLFYDSIKEYQKTHTSPDIKIYDPKYLHPCGLFDDDLCEYTCDDCYIVHTNYSSWSAPIRLLKFTIKYSTKIMIIIILIICFLILRNFVKTD